MATVKIVATQELQMMVTFVHVFQSCSQDSNAVLAIMEDIIGKLKAIMPTLETSFTDKTTLDATEVEQR